MFLIQNSGTSLEFPIECLMKEVKPVVTENDELQYQDKTKMNATFGLFFLEVYHESFAKNNVAGRVGGNIILPMLEFNSFSSSNFLSS